MNILFLAPFLALFLMFALALQAGILFLLAKLFKLNIPYRHAFAITALVMVAKTAIEVLVSFMPDTVLIWLISVVLLFVIFSVIFRHWSQASWGKLVGIFIVDFIITTVLIAVVVIPIRYFVIQPFYAKGAAMEPTIAEGTYLWIKLFNIQISRGDIIVFRYPKDQRQYFIKRVIGLPGEKVSISEGRLYINDILLNEPYLSGNFTPGVKEITLGQEEYFVLGDNRAASLDSRAFGPVPENLIIGEAAVKYEDWKLEKIETPHY